jgi:hypothetical protein
MASGCLSFGKGLHVMIHPVSLPIRRPLVTICSYGADHAKFIGEVQGPKLGVVLHGVIALLFKDGAVVMVYFVG